MPLVVDANIILSALVPNSKSLDLLIMLSRSGHELISPEFLLEEVNANIPDLVKSTGLTVEELKVELGLLLKRVKIFLESEYSQFLEDAKKVSPHKKDVPYFALSLRFDKSPIWSREPKPRRQKVVKVLSDEKMEEDFLK